MIILIETRNLGDWEYATPKSLANIGRETVLGRLQRQLIEMGYKPIVLADDYGVMAESKKVHLGDNLPEHVAILPGNAVYHDYLDILDASHDKPDRNVDYIETIDNYWVFIRKVVNAGKLNPTK